MPMTDTGMRSLATNGVGFDLVGYNVEAAVDTKHNLIAVLKDLANASFAGREILLNFADFEHDQGLFAMIEWHVPAELNPVDLSCNRGLSARSKKRPAYAGKIGHGDRGTGRPQG
jgi:hypothetical protein